jgi:membrane protein YqaA with SNARE-associated domain
MRHFLDVLISWGPLGVFVLSLVESLGIPNPGGTDALILVVAIAKPAEAMLAAAMATAGSLIGTVFFYELTRRGGEKFVARYTSSGRGARFAVWFQRYGLITVFIPALLPLPFLPFKVFAACAGAMCVPRWRFFLVLLAARVPHYFLLAYLGQQLGENSSAWLKSHGWQMAFIAALLFISLYALVRRVERQTLQ